MDLRFSEEQELLRSSADSFLRDRPRQRPSAAAADAAERDTWAAVAEMGWLGLPVPEEFDGLGLGHVELSIVAEALGRHLVAIPYVPSVVLATSLLKALGTVDRKRELLPAIAAGHRRIAVAHVRPDELDQPARLSLTATRQGDWWILDGSCPHVLDGHAGDILVTAAVRSGGSAPDDLGLFLLPAAATGQSVARLPLLDGGTAARLELAGVRCAANALIGQGEGARRAIMSAIDSAIVTWCGELTGIADAVLASTIAYVNTREQFGRSISSNQVVRHRLVDMAIAIEEARGLTLRAAIVLDSGDSASASRAASAAKAKTGRVARFVAEQAVQLHGAIGVTDELAIGSYLKRVLALEPLFGSPADHELRVARLRAASQ